MAEGTLKIWHGGVFKKVANGETIYEGGRGRTFPVDVDELCWWDLEVLAKKCGGYENIDGLFYLIPGLSLANGLRKVYEDVEVLKMAELVLKYRCVELYVYHGTELPNQETTIISPQNDVMSSPKKGHALSSTSKTYPATSQATKKDYATSSAAKKDAATSSILPTDTLANKKQAHTPGKSKNPTKPQKTKSTPKKSRESIKSPPQPTEEEISIPTLEANENDFLENYEWEDPRPESPLKFTDLYSDISDEDDDVDPDFELELASSDGDGDYVDKLEKELEDEEILADQKLSDTDESDEEYIASRAKTRSCNNKLVELAEQLQREAAEGKLGGVQSEATTGEGTSAAGGYVSEYEDSEDDIHTPPDSGDEDLSFERRRRRAVLVGEHTDFSVFRWKVGQRFPNRAAFKDAVAKYAVLQGRNVFIQSSNIRRQQRVGVKCVEGCPFYLYASWDSRREVLVVKRVEGEHTCHRNMKKNRQLKSTWVAKQFLEVFKARPHWPAKEIMETIRRAFKIVVKKEFAYKVKYAAHTLLHGSMHEHYKKVGGYVAAIKNSSPGTMVELVTDVSKQAFPPVFQRFYTCFEGLQRGWKQGCRKVIAVDACFLKTFLGGQLMSAIGRDGNDQMYPISWAVVEGENNMSWEWFFLLHQRSLDLGEGEGIAIISDEHQAILNAVAAVLPKAEHRHCARHIFAHWHKTWKGDEMKLLFWKIAKAYNLADYNDALEELTQLNVDAATAFKGYKPEVFCRAFLDTTMKTDAITSNIAETFNGYIIQARTKHLIFMLEDIRNNLMQRLVVKRQQMEKSTSILCPRIQQKLEKEKAKASNCDVIPSTDTLFNVNYYLDQLVVDLEARTVRL
ncbi:uncharacterized protein [Spinacia oleracea]|uniref:MULE transposase domain-containing protein n=1 Tax=Spinacia oleracea TaxID=3562 RepID=A0ABM3R4A0_SPIOL|nr:uncharacterized protein LOC130465626 [Spinacia oleracea]